MPIHISKLSVNCNNFMIIYFYHFEIKSNNDSRFIYILVNVEMFKCKLITQGFLLFLTFSFSHAIILPLSGFLQEQKSPFFSSFALQVKKNKLHKAYDLWRAPRLRQSSYFFCTLRITDGLILNIWISS